MNRSIRTALLAGVGLVWAGAIPVPAADLAPGTPGGQAEARRLDALPPVDTPRASRPPDDHSGRKQRGKASIYSHRFEGRKTSTGRRFSTHGNIAASKSLPLGTRAKVKNLETGKSAEVNVEDRGPHVAGRVVDLSPRTAQEIGLDRKEGVAPVEVAPIAVPQKDGSVKAGAGAAQ